MIRLLDKVPRETVVTFPVRLSHLVFAPLTLLLSVKSATSLTVWSHAGDPLPKYEVMTFLLWAYPNRIYIDLSEEHVRRVMDLLESLRKVVVSSAAIVATFRNEFCYLPLTGSLEKFAKLLGISCRINFTGAYLNDESYYLEHDRCSCITACSLG